MPFALLFVGIILLVAGLRGQIGNLTSLLKADFTGSGNYFYWVIAILAVGSIGYVKKLQPISDAFLTLILVVLFLSNKGFFSQFMNGITQTTTCNTTDSTTTVLGNQAEQSLNAAPTVMDTSATSLSQSLKNSLQNLNSALNSGAGYLGD